MEVSLSKPQTWNDMKLFMRETFVNVPSALNSYDEVNHLEEESVVISLAMSNLLQDNVHNQEDDMEDHGDLTTSCANSGPSLHNAPINPAENIGNAHGATLTEGENYLDVLHFSTHHAITEQLLVEPSLDLCLSQYDSLPIHSDKKEICENAYVKPMNPHAICVLEPNICV